MSFLFIRPKRGPCPKREPSAISVPGDAKRTELTALLVARWQRVAPEGSDALEELVALTWTTKKYANKRPETRERAMVFAYLGGLAGALGKTSEFGEFRAQGL